MTGGESLERDILELIASSHGPVGSCALHEQLGSLGYAISEPTVGRLLRHLDRQGYTRRVSNRGRELTGAGQERVHDLQAAHGRAQAERHLLSAMRPGSLDELLDVLVARRAIEKETARLAAQHATEAHIAEMEATIALQRQLWLDGAAATSQDVRFHHLVAEASGNRVLAAALDLIRQDSEVRSRLNAILKLSNLEPGRYHQELVEAIKQRSSDAAERAILAHINDLIERVLNARSAERRTESDGAASLQAASGSA